MTQLPKGARKRPGRAPGPAASRRDTRLEIKLTQAEYDALEAAALAAGESMAEILRSDARAAGHLFSASQARPRKEAPDAEA